MFLELLLEFRILSRRHAVNSVVGNSRSRCLLDLDVLKSPRWRDKAGFVIFMENCGESRFKLLNLKRFRRCS